MKYIAVILILCSIAAASPNAVYAHFNVWHCGPTVYDGDFCILYSTPVPWNDITYYHPNFFGVGWHIQAVDTDGNIFRQGGMRVTATVDSTGLSPEHLGGSNYWPVHVINAITRTDGDGSVTVRTSGKGRAGVLYCIGSVGGGPLCLVVGISTRATGTISFPARSGQSSMRLQMDIISQPCLLRGFCTGHLHDETAGIQQLSSMPEVVDCNRYAPSSYPVPGLGWWQMVQQENGSWQWESAAQLFVASLPEELVEMNEALNEVSPYAYVVADPLNGRFPQDAAIVMDGQTIHCSRTGNVYVSDWILPKDEGGYVKLMDKWQNTIHCFPVANGGTLTEKNCDPNMSNVLEKWLSTGTDADLDGNGIVNFEDVAISALKQ